MSKIRWHLGQLDAVRGLAVLGTVTVHCAYQFPWSRLAFPFLAGQRGVQLFFILSWFTLFLSFDNRKEEQSPTRNFFLRRVFRLTPLYYLMLVFATVVQKGGHDPWYVTLAAAFYLHGLFPSTVSHGVAGGWTLSCEAFSYLLLPVAFRFIRNSSMALKVLIVSAVCCGGLSWGLAYAFPHTAEFFTFLWFPVELPVFCLGALCYFLWKEGRLGTNRTLSTGLLVAVLLVFFPILPFTDRGLYGTSLMAAIVLVATLMHPWKFLVNRVTIFLGRISYSVYLLHGYLLHYGAVPLLEAWGSSHPSFQRPVQQTLIRLVLTLVMTIPVATLTWLFIEEPGIRLGRRLIARLEGKLLRAKDGELLVPEKAVFESGNSPDAQF